MNPAPGGIVEQAPKATVGASSVASARPESEVVRTASQARRAKARQARALSPTERYEAGLNHDGRPWGVPRMHINRFGEPKPCLSRGSAVAMALAYRMDPGRDANDIDAYECEFCGWWHIGTRRPKLRLPILAVECGQRVLWNLKAENSGPRSRRLSIVARRFHRQGREAIDPGNRAARERRLAARNSGLEPEGPK